MKYRLRDRNTGNWIFYGKTDEILESADKEVIQGLADECQDYGYDPEVIEVK